jgi:hypothetical protein
VTPNGIQNLGWQFYLVWTVANAFFLPVIYFFYPETGKFGDNPPSVSSRDPRSNSFVAADRTLEDLDTYYRENPSLIVTRDHDAISRKRPERYNEMHERGTIDAQAEKTENAVEHKP